ncbi:hypothetical protein GBA65_18160 [Rubrobacter marinus]|uniref:Uncharacterized protein n=1 Tax=Rubrobacter marinus TaxID=2653852 RepID=A0A6G8Q103_9ACTN|nr:hypothetical protein [Rubrobacter marinus]QIN80125.1 hypothetical protein GBA65_18160 [Rubrobacter marinus]
MEAASVEEFLRLLSGRESTEVPRGEQRGVAHRAVFVARLLDRRGSGYGYPKVGRYVVAAFAYGPDVISYERTISNAVELLGVAGKIAERQREAYEEVRTEIGRGIEGAGLKVPVQEGLPRHPTGAGEEG